MNLMGAHYPRRPPGELPSFVFLRSEPQYVCVLQQLDALIAASMSVKSSSKLRKILEVRLRVR